MCLLAVEAVEKYWRHGFGFALQQKRRAIATVMLSIFRRNRPISGDTCDRVGVG